jgi:hypothetical protein
VLRYGLMGLCSWLAKSTLRHGVAQERQGHRHASPFHPVGFFAQQRRDEKQRVFEKPKAPCNVRLAFVGGAHLGRAHLPDVHRGAKDTAGLGLLGLRHRCVVCLDVALDVPRAGLAWRARCGTALASVAFVFRQMRGRNTVLRPALGPRCEGLLSRFRSANALGLQGQEWFFEGRGCAPCGCLQRGLSTLQSRLCLPPQPTLGQTRVAHCQGLRAGVGIKGLPGGVLAGLAHDLRNQLQGGGNTSEQAQLGQMDGLVLTGELGIGDAIAGAGRSLDGAHPRLRLLLENPCV